MIEKKPYYITSAIAYTTGKPHIGNVYEIVLADAIARYKKMVGYDVRFQTGTDEHGQKVEQRAKEQGKKPKEFADEISAIVKHQFDVMNVQYDRFIRTTDVDHEKQVQKIFKKFYEQGDIYKGEYTGMYCEEDEAFMTASQLTEDGRCSVCGGPVKPMKEETYFFRMSKYADRLMKYIDEHPDFIQPESRKNEIINNFLKPGLQDLSVSRTSFSWGIPVDFDPKHVIYVWIDALSNYITGLGYDVDGQSDALFKKYWPADLHLVGKDIIRFHTIYWPIMLMALGLPLPKQIFGHPWLMVGESKMSKSLGNVIYADDMVNVFGTDAMRYIFLHEMPFAQDGHITYDLMVERINSDLANNLGNLVNRTLAMQNKYFNGVIANAHCNEQVDEELQQHVLHNVLEVKNHMHELRVQDALSAILDLFSRCNKYIDETMPWALAKEEKRDRLSTVLYNLLESIRIGGILLKPFLPTTADKILADLGTNICDFDSINNFGKLEVNIKVVDQPAILFQRLDAKEVASKINMINEKNRKENRQSAVKEEKKISLKDFQNIELKVARVLTCQKHPHADKLFILTCDLGSGDIRQIVSGLASSYTPGQVIGKNVVVIANLQACNIRGVESNGMLLAGKEENRVSLVEVDGLKPGTIIS